MAAVGSLMRAKVTRAGATGVWITINAHYPGVEFGPCDLVANIVRVGPLTTETASSHAHGVLVTQWLADLIHEGDDVLAVDTGSNDWLIVGTIRTGISTTGEPPS